jgi:acyl-CoA thioester hydrolase
MSKSNPLYEMTFPIRWGDMDALGHVNNTVYFRYFEQARVEFLEQLGYPARLPEDASDNSGGPVIVDAHCQYLIPVVYPATLKLTMSCGPAGRSSFDTLYELRDADKPQTLYATGSARVVWADLVKGGSMALPDKVRAQLPTSE